MHANFHTLKITPVITLNPTLIYIYIYIYVYILDTFRQARKLILGNNLTSEKLGYADKVGRYSPQSGPN